MDQKLEAPLKLLCVVPHLGERKIVEKYIQPDYPLYPLLKLLKSSAESRSPQETISEEAINEMRETMLERLTKKNVELIGSDLHTFEFCMDNLGAFLNAIDKNFSSKGNLLETTFAIIEILKKEGLLKNQKQKFHRILESCISYLLRLITKFYIYESQNFYIAESYCQKYSAWLDKAKHVDQDDIQKNVFFSKICLATIYFEFGHPNLAIELLKKAEKIVEKINTDDLDYCLPFFFDLYKKTIFHLHKNEEFLKEIQVFQNFFSLYKKFNEKIRRNIYKEYEFIKNTFDNAKSSYKKQFIEKVNASHVVKEHIASVSFSFNTNSLTLNFKSNTLDAFIKNTFITHGIKCEKVPEKGAEQFKFEVSLDVCTVANLEKVIISAVSQSNRILELKLVEEKKATASLIKIETPEQSTSYQTIFSSPEEKKAHEKTQSKEKKSAKNKKAMEEPDSSSKISPTVLESVQYHWPQSNLSYSSTNHDLPVKRLRRNTIPENICVWFGYIPDWVHNRENYNPEFEHKLIRGSIEKNCIRDITKELLTWGHQNFSKEKPYVFKIVIPGSGLGHDERLYGWIQETLVDDKGGKHHLICFGYLADHKTKYLPDPETIMQKENQEESAHSNVMKPQ